MLDPRRATNVWMLVMAAGAALAGPASAQNKAVPIENRPAATQPGAKGAAPTPPPAGGAAPTTPPPAHEIPPVTTDDPNMVTLSAFAEPVALSALVEMVATTLNVNITILGDVPGSVVFNAPVAVKKEDLLPLLESLLEQQQFTMVQDRFGWYTVHSINNVTANLGTPGNDNLTTTRVFRTPNMRPSALKTHLEPVIAGAGQGAKPYAYVDDLGIIIATDTPKRLDAVGAILRQVTEEYGRLEFIRLPLEHISGSTARDRALQLIGQLAQPSSTAAAPGGNAPAAAAANRPGGPLDNLGERLTVEQQGNALVFRGTPEEIEQVRGVISIIDVPNELVPRSYEAGSSASQVADIARNLGLGEVITISQARSGNDQTRFFNRTQGGQGQVPGVQGTSLGGPMMVVDEKRGKIVYYGTDSQQQRLAALLEQLDTQAEQVVIRVYKLRNAKAEDMQEIILGLIQNQTPMGEAPLLPGDTSGRPGRFRATPRPATPSPTSPGQPAGGGGGDEGLTIDSENSFVIADKPNNQLIVKAPAAQQPEFARLIEKLDLRRPQVYIEAKIVAVTADDQLRTAFETQLINASGTGGVFQQNFGLSTAVGTTGQPILNPRMVAAGLTGFTGAIIRSDQVPIIMTALANETDSRVIASPQLLVDDNEKAKVATVDSQPVAVVSRGTNGQGDIVTSGEDATAETSLEVTPHISEGGYLRMEYKIKLESFTGTPQQNLSPPKLSNNIDAASITVPSDSTVIIGGLVVDSKRKTVAKIPLLGDIPLVGLLFQDRTTNARNTVLYVFLTPKILREPTFTDLKLLTRGPQAKAGLRADIPSMSPSLSEIVAPAASQVPPAPAPAPAPALSRREQAPAPQPKPATTPDPAPPSPDGPSPDR